MSVNESYPVFQCPGCQQYISTKYDACRFCFLPLDDEIKVRAIKKEADDTRRYRLKMHKGVLYTGIGIFVVGVALSAVSFISIFVADKGVYFPWSPVIVLYSLGQIWIGLSGIREERKK